MTQTMTLTRAEGRVTLSTSVPWYIRLVDERPCGFNAGDANLYRYVGNEPTDATDPSGLTTEDRGKKRDLSPARLPYPDVPMPLIPPPEPVIPSEKAPPGQPAGGGVMPHEPPLPGEPGAKPLPPPAGSGKPGTLPRTAPKAPLPGERGGGGLMPHDPPLPNEPGGPIVRPQAPDDMPREELPFPIPGTAPMTFTVPVEDIRKAFNYIFGIVSDTPDFPGESGVRLGIIILPAPAGTPSPQKGLFPGGSGPADSIGASVEIDLPFTIGRPWRLGRPKPPGR